MYKKIINTYTQLGSVKETAASLGVSVVKVRRTLITAGLWRSSSSDAVCDLLKQGLSTKEIADRLSITPKAVEAYSPYQQGPYGNEVRSYSAIRCEHYRQRKNYALDHQINRGTPTSITKEGDSMILPVNVPTQTVQLHLELNCDHLDSQEASILREYGKVNKSLSRDVLVPSSITLHALHYVIQRAFGWQNSHLHHFELPEETFKMLTGGRFKRWGELCGIYFRMPSEDFEDL